MSHAHDAETAARKLKFFNIGSEDLSRFAHIAEAMRRHAPPALDALYDQIAATPETARFFGSRQMMKHARDKQIDHWAAMFGGGVDARYFESAERVGNIHARIGLEPGWYIGAYATVLERIVNAMFSGFGAFFRRRQIARSVGSMIKMALLDMEVALSSYFKAEEAARIAVIDEVSGALKAMASGDFATRVPDLPAAFAELQKHLDGMRLQVSGVLADVADTSGSVDLGAREIRQASDDLARRTEQ
ncbi:MAG: protoglobin domain-containing protein [Novosphingobium meiothermophilum]